MPCDVIYILHVRYILHYRRRSREIHWETKRTSACGQHVPIAVFRSIAECGGYLYLKQELADAVGATRQTIGLIEAGRYNPSLKLCTAICKELGMTLDGLFWDEGR